MSHRPASFVFCFLALLFSSPAKTPGPPQPIGGSLFIHGGGALPPPLMEKFLKLCDRPKARLVVIPTAAEDDKIDEFNITEHWGGRGFAAVDILHTRSREEADTEAFVKPLREAGAVWISGGLQVRLEKAYVGTRVGEELRALVARGGVVGGSSAGAAVMSRVMIRSGNPVAEVGEGFGLLPGAVIDQHFVAREREPRLRKVLEDNPGLVGYGVDEGTALIVQGRRLSVAGKSSVTVCLAESKTRRERFATRVDPGRGDYLADYRAAIARAAEVEFPPADPILPVVRNGTVVAFGGGSTSKSGLERFVEAAGGKGARIVVIYTAMSDQPRMPKHWRRLWDSVGVKNVRTLHAKNRAQANSEGFVKQIDAAGGVWFTGGRQWRLVDRYFGTDAHAAISRVLDRGGAVGGSSAGATICGDYLVRGDPVTSRTMMQEGYERGLGLVPGIAIDQHFAQRNRFRDMVALKRRYPQLWGMGIDEGTAVAFEDGECEVYGRSAVYIYPVGGGEAVKLEAGDRYDFSKRESVSAQEPEEDPPCPFD